MVQDGSGSGPLGGPTGKPGGARGTRHRLLGPRSDSRHNQGAGSPAQPQPQFAPSAPARQKRSAKQRVLFVCIGNAIRSQMAEAFARAYGADVMETGSAGTNPATMIAPLTHQILAEHNLRIDEGFPKGLDLVSEERWDLVINMSGSPLSIPGARLIEWQVQDPIGLSETVYRNVANQLERLVMRLILELRAELSGGQR